MDRNTKIGFGILAAINVCVVVKAIQLHNGVGHLMAALDSVITLLDKQQIDAAFENIIEDF